MRIAFFVNRVETELPVYTTSRLALEAHRRDHRVWYVDAGNLGIGDDGALRGFASPVPDRRFRTTETFIAGVGEARPGGAAPEELDVFWLRNDPAEDAADRPRTIVTRDLATVRSFLEEGGGDIVLKPLQGSGGDRVFVVRAGDVANLNQIFETVTASGYVVAQEFLPAAVEGDVRLFLMNGRPLEVDGRIAAFKRVYDGEYIRNNMSVGGRAGKVAVGPAMLALAEAVRPKLLEDGMFLVGPAAAKFTPWNSLQLPRPPGLWEGRMRARNPRVKARTTWMAPTATGARPAPPRNRHPRSSPGPARLRWHVACLPQCPHSGISRPGGLMSTSRNIALGAALLAVVPAAAISDGVGVFGERSAPDSAVVRGVRELISSDDLQPTLGNGPEPDPRLAEFYGDPGATVLWVDGDGPTPATRAFLRELEDLDREGLEPDTFHLSRIRASLGGLADDGPGVARQARTELLVSAAFLQLADALGRGVGNPGDEGLEWDLERDAPPGPEVLRSVAAGEPPPDVLDALRPRLPWYGRLVDALARYRALAGKGGWPSVSAGEPVEAGDSSAAVAEVRARLLAGGDPRAAELAARGQEASDVFDPDLARAVERFQERHGIERDGVVGPETVEAMNVPAEERVDALRLNLDRLRRMPRSLGERAILVNVAGFELLVLEHERPVLSMGVVVGEPEARTRVFTADMRYVVFNPYWHVPESIARDEILPAVRDDPSYLESNRLEVVPADDPMGEPVSTEDMDWDDVEVDSWPFLFRQEPGPGNSLGRVKFMFPNEHHIYLHDTPADHLFARTFRAFSHGCIRVERPEALARYVLRNATERPPEDVAVLMEAGRTEQVDLTSPIPVFITYLTAWVDDDGTVRFHRDPYGLDATGAPAGGASSTPREG